MENEKRVFDEGKQNELLEYDLQLGKLVDDKLFIAHHEAMAEVQEQSRIEVIATYENGGKDVRTVVDMPYSAAQEHYDEYEDILVYIPYSVSELKVIANKKRKVKIQSRLTSISQDIVQNMAGEIVPNIDERKLEFIALHNELRALEGKLPRAVVVGE